MVMVVVVAGRRLEEAKDMFGCLVGFSILLCIYTLEISRNFMAYCKPAILDHPLVFSCVMRYFPLRNRFFPFCVMRAYFIKSHSLCAKDFVSKVLLGFMSRTVPETRCGFSNDQV